MKAKMGFALIASLPLIHCAVARSEQHTSRDIGSRRQLFIDDYMIASMHGLKRSFHPAQKHPQPVMLPEHPWEGVGTANWPSVYMIDDSFAQHSLAH